MVQNLIAALRDDLETLPWMGAETRKAALAKLDAFTPKIGYPTSGGTTPRSRWTGPPTRATC